MYTVFPEIKAWASISFSQILSQLLNAVYYAKTNETSMQPGVLHPCILHAVSAKGMANPRGEWKENANQGGALLRDLLF